MRVLNICAAVSGLVSLVMLALAAHVLDAHPESVADVNLGGFIQLGAAAAGLAVANRRGVLNMIGGGLIVAGAAIFAGALYTVALTQNASFAMAAPAGGLSLMAGFLVLAFARPGP